MEFIERHKSKALLEFRRFDAVKAVFDIVAAIFKPPLNHHCGQMYFKPADKAPFNLIAISWANLLNYNDIIKKTTKPPKTP